MSPHSFLRDPRIILPLVTDRDTVCLPRPLDSYQLHQRLILRCVRRVPWLLTDRNHQAEHRRQQMQVSLCPDILPLQLTHLFRRASHQVHQSLQLPHSQLHHPPPDLLCHPVLHNNLNPCTFHKQHTTSLARHHHRLIFLHPLCQHFPLLHNQHHLRFTQGSYSQVLASRTNICLPLPPYHKLLPV